jgi:RNA-binding protein
MLQTPATSRSKSRKKAPSAGDEKTAAPALTKRRLQELKAQAHHLEPLVHIGHGGLHDAAYDAIARALRDHELIKVRLHEPEDKRVMARELADRAGAALCGLVGHTVILFKAKPPKPKPKPSRTTRR